MVGVLSSPLRRPSLPPPLNGVIDMAPVDERKLFPGGGGGSGSDVGGVDGELLVRLLCLILPVEDRPSPEGGMGEEAAGFEGGGHCCGGCGGSRPGRRKGKEERSWSGRGRKGWGGLVGEGEEEEPRRWGWL